MNAADQTPAAANDALTFATTQVEEGTAITHTAGTGTFTLTENGTYQVIYNTVVSDATGTTPPVSVGVTLQNNGTAITGTDSTATITAANDTATLSGNTVVQVTAAPVTITLNADNTNGEFSNTAISIRKLD